jgi:hypothetical protein
MVPRAGMGAVKERNIILSLTLPAVKTPVVLY